jgi:hypothetical protein
MTQGNQEKAKMKNPAENPGPLIALEKALEKDNFTDQSKITPVWVTGAGVVGILRGAGVRAYCKILFARPARSTRVAK